ncbi:NmrA family NAD(P)-binding protein [Chitinophaga niabensis]|uniref:Uncharacterized conserved protein YbjT, contains NAD(P)-binding and DUF2867 domains n=1 Tax=Chitinophaga niabensis TaxID=536979 RepID=A0A1N6K072_9BACT|nr:NmrA family NAD(P)-binding protein [Chitinophaga niabensis]SIO49992.1 Uncharacterized conserved protein YbjT, contains NAD(P)-binding and DUF2867 domains [Chitinophaga niabensis]
MFTILSATGKTGSEIIKFFSAAGIPCNAVTSDLSRSVILPHINWVENNIPAGTKKLFLNTAVTADMFDVQRRFIDTAKDAGVEHIVKLSTPGASPTSKDRTGQVHWQIEEYLRNSGMNWNSLQPQTFMQNWLGNLANNVRQERKIYAVAGDGKKAFTDTRDIGEVAFTLLTDPKKYINKIIPLSGPAPVSYYEVAAAISDAIGETVTYIPQTPEEGKARMEKAGFPEWAVQMNLLVDMGQRSGAAEKLFSDNVAEILGKPGRSIYDFAKDHSKSFI